MTPGERQARNELAIFIQSDLQANEYSRALDLSLAMLNELSVQEVGVHPPLSVGEQIIGLAMALGSLISASIKIESRAEMAGRAAAVAMVIAGTLGDST